MSGRKNHGNNAKRFDVNAFYANLRKAKVLELLDKDGNTPYDSDAIDNSVWEYAAYLYNDINNLGILSYFDSDSFRHDSDGSGENGFGDPITRTAAVTKVYNPLRRFLYSVDNQDGIDDSDDVITSGFRRKYYTLPMSDSEGTLRHVNIYTILKAHFNRWLKYDPYERRYIAKRVFDVLNADSDMRYDFARMTVVAFEEDSDLMRRVVEQVSNVLQSDSEIRNEMVLTTITAFQNDSDAARNLVNIIHNVYQTDSEKRVELNQTIMVGFENDSDSARRLVEVINNVFQTDSETRNELLQQILLGLQNDSDSMRSLVSIVNNVYENDSDYALFLTELITNTYENDSDTAYKLTSIILEELNNDSEYKNKLSTILSNTHITNLIPGTTSTHYLGDSEHTFKYGYIDNLQVDSELKVSYLTEGRLVLVGADGVIIDSDELLYNDSELVVNKNLEVNGDIETQSFTMDGVTTSHMKALTIKDSGGTTILAGYLLSTSNDSDTL